MKILVWIIVVFLIGLGIYWYANRSVVIDSVTIDNNDANQNTKTLKEGVDYQSSAKTVTVIYGANGFSPSTITIKRGDTVTFVNQSSGSMWVGSAMHPDHKLYDGTDLKTHCASRAVPSFDSCKNMSKGDSYSFTFNKIGAWGYHNHSAANHFGKIIVE